MSVSSRFLAHHPREESPRWITPDGWERLAGPRPPVAAPLERTGGGGVRDGSSPVLALGWMGVVMTAG